MLNGLDLFSGIGGLSLALSEWVSPIAYCEIDPYCQGVLHSNISNNRLSRAPIWDDIRTLGINKIGNIPIDIIYGGFPCQDISIGGTQKGLEGQRSGLFFEMLRLAQEIRPQFIFIENVPGITTNDGVRVVKEIAEAGYDCRWCIISADKFVDQKRHRWFLLAQSCSVRQHEGTCERIQSERQAGFYEEPSNYKLPDMESWGAFARSMRKDHGIPFKVDRIRALGNSVVPQQAKEAFKILMGLK